jgi:phosphoadenosine phosphosulfate reductase
MTISPPWSPPPATLERIAADFSPAVFASSLAAEDMVLTDLILKAGLPIGIFSLETGRLHPETLAVLDKVKAKLRLRHRPVQAADRRRSTPTWPQNGLNAFYDSVEMRRECCRIRKVEPLGRALAGNKAWVTGQRRAQSTTRAELAVQEDDAGARHDQVQSAGRLVGEDVWNYIRDNDVPYNALHDQGFPSIGCAPCTRAVQPGEDVRAGRWWWENPDSKECGLHMVDGKLIRIKSVAA